MYSRSDLKSWAFALFLGLLFLPACHSEVAQSSKEYTPDPGHHGRHRFATEDYGRALLPLGDTLQVDFPSFAPSPHLSQGLAAKVEGKSVLIWAASPSAQVKSAHLTTSHTSLGNQTVSKQTLSASFPAVGYSLGIHLVNSNFSVPVMAGDANNDGRVDMLDLYPISLGIRKAFPPGTFSSQTPAKFTPGGVYSRPPSQETWTNPLNQKPVDFVHADCNMDGRIDLEDLKIVDAVLKPLLVPKMLSGVISRQKLNAVPNGPIEYAQYADQQGNIVYQNRIRYDIQIDQSNAQQTGGSNSQDGDQLKEAKLLGVVFTRPVAEDRPRYSVFDIQAITTHSHFFNSPKDMLHLQRFWRDTKIDQPDSCKDFARSFPLDVGAFDLDSLVVPDHGDCIISCLVTIDDMLRSSGKGQVTQVYQHLFNIVVFRELPNGQVVAQTTDCSFDAVQLQEAESISYTQENLPSNWPKQVDDPQNRIIPVLP